MEHNRPQLSPEEIEGRLIEMQKIIELSGGTVTAEMTDRCRRILTGETTPDEAMAELDRKYGLTQDE